MNIVENGITLDIVAKTCNCKERDRKVTYSFVDSCYTLCQDKKDILSNELQACEKLLKYCRDPLDRRIVEREIADLKLMLDLIQ